MKKLVQIILLSSLIFFSGCNFQPNSQKSKIDATLPVIAQIRTISDVTSIALEWVPFYQEDIAGYNIYRSNGTSKLIRVATISDRFHSHYIDRNLKPNTTYFYAITVYTQKGTESKPGKRIEVRTLPLPEPVPFFKAIDHLPREVKLIWRPHPYPRTQGYELQRSEPERQEWKSIAKLEGRLTAEYIDRNLKDNHIYLYRIRIVTCDGVHSPWSEVVKASTKPKPSIVKGLHATTNLPKRIVLEWLSNPEPDIAYYKIYKSIFEFGPYIVTAKTKGTRYVDVINEDGVKRYYKVTAVDKDGLESFKQDAPIVGMTLSKPLPPVIVVQKFDGKKLFLKWESPDGRAVEYRIEKRIIKGFMDIQPIVYQGIKSTNFSDSGFEPGVTYKYKILAIDKNGLVSNPSQEIVIKIKK